MPGLRFRMRKFVYHFDDVGIQFFTVVLSNYYSGIYIV